MQAATIQQQIDIAFAEWVATQKHIPDEQKNRLKWSFDAGYRAAITATSHDSKARYE